MLISKAENGEKNLLVYSIEEELRTSAIWLASICHRQSARLVRDLGAVLVSKFIRNGSVVGSRDSSLARNLVGRARLRTTRPSTANKQTNKQVPVNWHKQRCQKEQRREPIGAGIFCMWTAELGGKEQKEGIKRTQKHSVTKSPHAATAGRRIPT